MGPESKFPVAFGGGHPSLLVSGMRLEIPMKAAAILLCATLVTIPATAAAQQLPSDLRSAQQLAEDGGRDSWTYRNPAADLTKYKGFIVEPTVVYSDPAASWGGTSPAQRGGYAEMLTRDLRDEIGGSYTLAEKPGPGVATMRLTLLGVVPTVPGVAAATRVTPIGLALNGVKSLEGKPGTFTGSAQLAFELYDSRSNELLLAAVRRRSPNALDISAALTTDNTMAAISKDAATTIRKAVDNANGR